MLYCFEKDQNIQTEQQSDLVMSLTQRSTEQIKIQAKVHDDSEGSDQTGPAEGIRCAFDDI